MNNAKYIQANWAEFRNAINKTYMAHEKDHSHESQALRDYAEVAWSDDLAALLGRETANERQHRRNQPSPDGFSVGCAAMLILMRMAADGSELTQMPSAAKFLTCRQSAVEAEVIGYLCRNNLTQAWREAVRVLDYAKLMQVA
jgi:hypothetical protein